MKTFIEKKANIHLIGCGRMGGSILAAWIKRGYPLKNIFVEELNPSEWLRKKSNEGLNLNYHQPKDIKYCILELGMNNYGEISKLSKIAKPHISIITNIGSAHIGNFKNGEPDGKGLFRNFGEEYDYYSFDVEIYTL